jgi:hypothetical protein
VSSLLVEGVEDDADDADDDADAEVEDDDSVEVLSFRYDIVELFLFTL